MYFAAFEPISISCWIEATLLNQAALQRSRLLLYSTVRITFDYVSTIVVTDIHPTVVAIATRGEAPTNRVYVIDIEVLPLLLRLAFLPHSLLSQRRRRLGGQAFDHREQEVFVDDRDAASLYEIELLLIH
jgi:hypothetical protein